MLKTSVAFKETNNRIKCSFVSDRPFMSGSDAQTTTDSFVQVEGSLSWRFFAMDPELINSAASLRWKGLHTHIYLQRDVSVLHRRQSCATIENRAITHDKRQLIRELFSRLQLRAHVERWRQDRAEVPVEKRGETAGPVDCAMLRSPINVDICITNAPKTDLPA